MLRFQRALGGLSSKDAALGNRVGKRAANVHPLCVVKCFALIAVTVKLAGALTPAAAGTLEQAKVKSENIPVANFTGFTGTESFLAKHLSNDLKKIVRDRKLTVWGFTEDFELGTDNFCVALVGLAYADSVDRNARVPAHLFASISHGPSTAPWDPWKCRQDNFAGAVTNLNNAPVEKALENIDHTLPSAGHASAVPSGQTSLVVTSGVPDVGDAAIERALKVMAVDRAFDPSNVQVDVQAYFMQMDDGTQFCLATAGLVGRPPVGRQSRTPAYMLRKGRMQRGGSADECRATAALDVTQALFAQPWDASSTGILFDFKRAGEDGLPIPDPAKVSRFGPRPQQ